MIINWYYKEKLWYDHKLRQCFLSGHAENKLLLPPVKPESYLTTWQSKSLAAFHLGLKIFSLQMTLPLDECPLQKVITLSLNLHFRNLKQWKKMTEKNKHILFMTSPPSLCWYHINNGVRGRWTAWIVSMRVQGDRKRCHDQLGALTSHSFTPVTNVSWQDSPSELPGHLGPCWSSEGMSQKTQHSTAGALSVHSPCRTGHSNPYSSSQICTLAEGCIFQKVCLLCVQLSWVWKLTGDEATGSGLTFTSSSALRNKHRLVTLHQQIIRFFFFSVCASAERYWLKLQWVLFLYVHRCVYMYVLAHV